MGLETRELGILEKQRVVADVQVLNFLFRKPWRTGLTPEMVVGVLFQINPVLISNLHEKAIPETASWQIIVEDVFYFMG